MENAKRDCYGVSSMLAIDTKSDQTVAVTATDAGALNVSSGKIHKKTLKLDLGIARDKVPFSESFNEITFPKINGHLILYLDTPIETKSLSIEDRMSLETSANTFYISNILQPGKLVEIWLWE